MISEVGPVVRGLYFLPRGWEFESPRDQSGKVQLWTLGRGDLGVGM